MWTSPRPVTVVAGISVLLNVFLVGIVFGHVVGARRHPGGGPIPAAGPLVPPAHVKALAPEERKRFRAAMAPYRPGIKAAREAHREARRMVEADIEAPIFDRAKVSADFAALRKASQGVEEAVDGALVDALAQLPAVDRASLVAHVPRVPAANAAAK